MEKITQYGKIRAYLDSHGNASVRELFIGCNINSPTKRISEMVSAGVPIKSFWVDTTNERGERVRFKKYYMEAGR